MLLMTETLDRLRKAKNFTNIDHWDTSYQIGIKERDK